MCGRLYVEAKLHAEQPSNPWNSVTRNPLQWSYKDCVIIIVLVSTNKHPNHLANFVDQVEYYGVSSKMYSQRLYAFKAIYPCFRDPLAERDHHLCIYIYIELYNMTGCDRAVGIQSHPSSFVVPGLEAVELWLECHHQSIEANPKARWSTEKQTLSRIHLTFQVHLFIYWHFDFYSILHFSSGINRPFFGGIPPNQMSKCRYQQETTISKSQ